MKFHEEMAHPVENSKSGPAHCENQKSTIYTKKISGVLLIFSAQPKVYLTKYKSQL